MGFLDVYQFWFEECTEQDWWKKSAEFDRTIEIRFGDVHLAAVRGELAYWRAEPIGALCEVIVLDQFSRNIYRDKANSFASDPLALCLAQHAIEKGFDKRLATKEVSFLYMPFMHSESAIIHEQALVLFNSLPNYEFELKHKQIIDKFGRYPHRNAILGRPSTKEELMFLAQPGSSF